MSNNKSVGMIVALWLAFSMAACVGEREQMVSPSPHYDLIHPPTFTMDSAITSSLTETTVSLSTSTFTQVLTNTQIPTSTQVPAGAQVPFPTPTPTCELYDNDDKPCILHNDIFFHQGPRSEELDAALAETFPRWSSFRQSLEWRTEPASVGEIIKDASFDMEFDINPAVTLVTVGMLLDWQLPPDGDLFSPAHEVADELSSLYYDYYFDKGGVQDEYSEVHNPFTYALYAFFDYDQVRLNEWCVVYSKLYKQSPLCTP